MGVPGGVVAGVVGAEEGEGGEEEGLEDLVFVPEADLRGDLGVGRLPGLEAEDAREEDQQGAQRAMGETHGVEERGKRTRKTCLQEWGESGRCTTGCSCPTPLGWGRENMSASTGECSMRVPL